MFSTPGSWALFRDKPYGNKPTREYKTGIYSTQEYKTGKNSRRGNTTREE